MFERYYPFCMFFKSPENKKLFILKTFRIKKVPKFKNFLELEHLLGFS